MKYVLSSITKLLVTILIISGSCAINAQAQTYPVLIVSIPFPFIVGSQRIAPGTYDFSLESQFLLSVRNAITGDKEMFPVRPEQQRAIEQKGRLIFHNFPDCSALSEVHFPGTSAFTKVINRKDVECVDTKRRSSSTSSSANQNGATPRKTEEHA